MEFYCCVFQDLKVREIVKLLHGSWKVVEFMFLLSFSIEIQMKIFKTYFVTKNTWRSQRHLFIYSAEKSWNTCCKGHTKSYGIWLQWTSQLMLILILCFADLAWTVHHQVPTAELTPRVTRAAPVISALTRKTLPQTGASSCRDPTMHCNGPSLYSHCQVGIEHHSPQLV